MPLESAEPIEVGHRPAAIAAARAESDRGPVDVRLLAIGWSPALVYRLGLIAPVGGRGELDAWAQMLIDGFRPLSPVEAKRFPPYRLRVVMATTSDTVMRLARRMAFDSDRELRFRALNRLGAAGQVHAGQMVKIVE
jgi:predicted Zn-dependent protease